MLHCQTQIKAPLDEKRPFPAAKKQTVERVYGKPLLYRLFYRHSSSISLKKKKTITFDTLLVSYSRNCILPLILRL